MTETSKKQTPGMSEREGGKLRQFYYHSGVRENSTCVKNTQYQMTPLSTNETKDQHCHRVIKEGD